MRSAAGMREYIDGRTEPRNGGRTEWRNEKREPGAGWKAPPRGLVDRPGAVDVRRRRPGGHAAGRRRRRAVPPRSPAEKPDGLLDRNGPTTLRAAAVYCCLSAVVRRRLLKNREGPIRADRRPDLNLRDPWRGQPSRGASARSSRRSRAAPREGGLRTDPSR